MVRKFQGWFGPLVLIGNAAAFLVGLALDNSPAAIAALIGMTVTAGGMRIRLVPVDASRPVSRLTFRPVGLVGAALVALGLALVPFSIIAGEPMGVTTGTFAGLFGACVMYLAAERRAV